MRSNQWLKYASDCWELDSVKEVAKELREKGGYKIVKVVKQITENGKDYGNIYLIK